MEIIINCTRVFRERRKNPQGRLPPGQFMGGSEPNLADLAVYGCLAAIEGTAAFQVRGYQVHQVILFMKHCSYFIKCKFIVYREETYCILILLVLCHLSY